jgi:hypothetical protein
VEGARCPLLADSGPAAGAGKGLLSEEERTAQIGDATSACDPTRTLGHAAYWREMASAIWRDVQPGTIAPDVVVERCHRGLRVGHTVGQLVVYRRRSEERAVRRCKRLPWRTWRR